MLTVPLFKVTLPTLTFKLVSPTAPLKVVVPTSAIVRFEVPFNLFTKVILLPEILLSVATTTAPL